MLKIRWKTMRDNFRREYIKQLNTRSGSSDKSSRIYCHYAELQFLKPVMQQRQTESNMSLDTDQTQEDVEHIDETQLLFDEEDAENAPEPAEPQMNKDISRSRPKNKGQQTQEFIDVVKNLITSQKQELGEIVSFRKKFDPSNGES
ncbi:hypothetical protein AB205_0142720 [Aquarana catesbeiana]|uniref:MADF domain-containing protein n=1 Tax=Aquarana catesbeiana TaxID=8400 RepID=A0A2G9S180_AQUCT|nr:hypothetical protein AB205_0142720 [Aquarana catesbeiana]